jgi:hypothetical protein
MAADEEADQWFDDAAHLDQLMDEMSARTRVLVDAYEELHQTGVEHKLAAIAYSLIALSSTADFESAEEAALMRRAEGIRIDKLRALGTWRPPS